MIQVREADIFSPDDEEKERPIEVWADTVFADSRDIVLLAVNHGRQYRRIHVEQLAFPPMKIN